MNQRIQTIVDKLAVPNLGRFKDESFNISHTIQMFRVVIGQIKDPEVSGYPFCCCILADYDTQFGHHTGAHVVISIIREMLAGHYTVESLVKDELGGVWSDHFTRAEVQSLREDMLLKTLAYMKEIYRDAR